MKTIWKFPIELTDTQTVKMPRAARILTAQVQDGQICLWAEVYDDAKKEDRIIEIVGTGNPFTKGILLYIATVQKDSFVWHIYEQPK